MLSSPILSAATISAWLVLEESPSQVWIDWAAQELLAGHDGPNLRILAGLSPPFDPWETRAYAQRAIAELTLTSAHFEDAIGAHVTELLRLMLSDPALTSTVLGCLEALCIRTDYRVDLMPFYLLSNGLEQQASMGGQHYYECPDGITLDEAAGREARAWLATHSSAA